MDNQTTTEDASALSEVQVNDSSSILINMEGMIKSHISSIERLEEDYRKHKEMLDDIFNNDPTFKEHSEAAKEAARIKSQTKQQILKRPQAAELSNKVKSFKSEMSELKAALSDYLREYERMSGINEIEDDQGTVREIVYIAKLIKKGALR